MGQKSAAGLGAESGRVSRRRLIRFGDNARVQTRDLRQVSYFDADAQWLTAEVQQEYVGRYGGPDDSPVEPDEFSPPNGTFVIAYVNSRPVAMGGWRLPASAGFELELGGIAAELKRMYVRQASRGQGHARALLAHLEKSALAAGAQWMVLETGLKQPEAIALYEAAGYRPIPPFGHYASHPLSVHLGKRL
jgi:GNAT superfamily N-acetyltransferase